MKILKHIPAILTGLLFLAGGITYLFKLVPTPPMEGDILAWNELFSRTGYMAFIKVLEVLGGALLMILRTRALGWVILSPIIVNIVAFEFMVAKQPGIGLALIAFALIGIYLEKDKFKAIWM